MAGSHQDIWANEIGDKENLAKCGEPRPRYNAQRKTSKNQATVEHLHQRIGQLKNNGLESPISIWPKRYLSRNEATNWSIPFWQSRVSTLRPARGWFQTEKSTWQRIEGVRSRVFLASSGRNWAPCWVVGATILSHCGFHLQEKGTKGSTLQPTVTWKDISRYIAGACCLSPWCCWMPQ